jgi:hypothetical protein
LTMVTGIVSARKRSAAKGLVGTLFPLPKPGKIPIQILAEIKIVLPRDILSLR